MLNRLLSYLDHRTNPSEVMPGADGVRALAVLLVVAFHIHAFSGAPELRLFGVISVTGWLNNGLLGVQLFFVLSGFLLMLPWARAYYCGSRPPVLRDYFRRRLLRIVPAYYVHLAVLFLALAPAVHSYGFLASPEGRLNILAHLSFTQFFFPSTATGAGLNGALWTLSIEAQFYLLLPWVARWFVGKRLPFGIATALLLSGWWSEASSGPLLELVGHAFANGPPTFYDPMTGYEREFDPFLTQMFLANQFPAQAFHFAIGMAAASLFAWRRALGPVCLPRGLARGGLAGGVLSLAAALPFFYAAGSPLQLPSTERWYALQALACALLVFSASYPNRFQRLVLSNPAMRVIGITSYSIYLWHVPVCFAVERYLSPPDLDPLQSFAYLGLVGGGASLAVACLSYVYVEKPFLYRRGHYPVRIGTEACRSAAGAPSSGVPH